MLIFSYTAVFLPDPVIVTDTQSLLLREMEKEASRKRRVSPSQIGALRPVAGVRRRS